MHFVVHSQILPSAMLFPTLWRSYSKSTRIVVAALLIVSFQTLIFRVVALNRMAEPMPLKTITVPFLQLVPRYAIFYPWVFITSIFAETSLIGFFVSLVVLASGTSYVEKFWGTREVLKFILLIGSITNLVTVMVSIISNILREDVKGMDLPSGGGLSYYFGFLIVLKQLIPEHNVVLFQGLMNFRIKHASFVTLVVMMVASLLTKSIYPAVPSITSFLVSYNYLRFFQSLSSDPLLPITSVNGDPSSSTVIRGDASDAFQFVELFPSASKPFLAPVFNAIYDVSVWISIVTPFNDDAVEHSNLRAQKRSERANQANRLIANSVAERRRQVALQVIEDRVSRT